MKNLSTLLKYKVYNTLLIFVFLTFPALVKAQVTLYGMTQFGGINDSGNIFKFNTKSLAFTDLVDFTGNSGSYRGGFPMGNIIEASDGNLYGITYDGGVNGTGTIFKYNPFTAIYSDLVDFTGNSFPNMGLRPHGSLVQVNDSNLYGLTREGGFGYCGNLFKYNIISGKFTDLFDFTGYSGPFIGKFPTGDLIKASDGNLYGMTSAGGKDSVGNIFKYNPSTGIFTDLVDFTGISGFYKGIEPIGSLVQTANGYLYGMTNGGGINYGNIFNYNITTGVYTDLIDFTGSSGSYIGNAPSGNMIQAADSNLYGMTSGGGANYGNIFSYNPTTKVFSDLVDFSGTSGSYNGWSPTGSLIQASDGNLYGMTYEGGVPGNGNMFSYNITSKVYSDLVDFTGTKGLYAGANPSGSLLEYKTPTAVEAISSLTDAIFIYPNPTSKFVNIGKTGFHGKVTFTMFDISERELSIQANENKSLISLNVSTLSPGLYFLKIYRDYEWIMTKKIIITR